MSHPIRITDRAYEMVLEIREKFGFTITDVASILIIYGYGSMELDK